MKRCVPTLLLAPNSLLWEGLARLLSTTDYKPIRYSSSLEDLVENAEFDPKHLMIVVGWDSGGRTKGDHCLSQVRALRELYRDASLVVMTASFDVNSVIASLHEGVDGYILSSMSCEMLTKSFDLVMSGETVLPSEFTRTFCSAKSEMANGGFLLAPQNAEIGADFSHFHRRSNGAGPTRKLSGREIAIMSCLREGDSNKTIARRVGLAEATVKTHVKTILRKIGAKNRTQAALWAIANLSNGSDHGPNGAANGDDPHKEMNDAARPSRQDEDEPHGLR